jgi:hypothetical protein
LNVFGKAGLIYDQSFFILFKIDFRPFKSTGFPVAVSTYF